MSSNADGLDVMASVITVSDLKSCRNTFDLLALLTHRSTDRIFEESKSGFVDLLSIYRWAAANKVSDGLVTFARYLRESNSVPPANYLGSSSYGATGGILHTAIGVHHRRLGTRGSKRTRLDPRSCGPS